LSSQDHPRISPVLYLVLTAYILIAGAYSVLVPIYEVSDELWHYPMVKYIADNSFQLPVQDPANVGPWRQEGSQPPLYYMMAALLTSGINTDDMQHIRRQNPHADIGLVLPDHNLNMMTHRPEGEQFPWQGSVLALHLTRFFSVALGAGTVLVSYFLARELLPKMTVLHWGAAALTAFLPMFVFISGAVNNDNLSNFLGNLLTLLIVRLLKAESAPHWREYVILGIITGAGLLAKFNIGFLTLIIALSLLIISLRLRNWRPLIFGGLISGGLTILIAGWWYLRNIQLYGDPTGLNTFLDIVGRRAIPANAAQLWAERDSFINAFWGFFGGMNLPMPDMIYIVLNIIAGLAAISALAFVLYSLFLRRRWTWQDLLPLSITVLWPVVSFVSYLRWTAETPASQGRLMFGTLSSIMLWLGIGLICWWPRRLQAPVMGFASVGMAALSIFALFGVILPAYAKPAPLPISESILTTYTHPENMGSLHLTGFELLTQEAQPESYVELDVRWQIETPFSENWSQFVHLVTPDGVIVGQRDVYPGQGLLATEDLSPGFAWENRIAVWVPSAAYAPMPLDVYIGWYHLDSGRRLSINAEQETYHLGQVNIIPRDSELDVPNPIRINFGDQIELVGYEISAISPTAGETTELTLYWRALQPITADYKIFANILDPLTLTKYASSDGMPAQWTAPTSTWEPGAIIEDPHTLSVDPNAPPGIYELEIGWYQELDGEFPRLRVFTPDGGQANNFIYLNRIRIIPAVTEDEP
jgi:4-amino-4-deoxy-L-arabinose transferase-like glycosyltransferase